MAKQLILGGRVQGVYCRRYCTENAREIGLKGSATNLSDGTVQVIIDTDDKEKISKYIHALKQNPFGFKFYGKIEEVSISDYSGPVRGDYIF